MSYDIFIGEFSNIGTVVNNYSKDADASASSAKTSSTISSKYSDMIREFRSKKITLSLKELSLMYQLSFLDREKLVSQYLGNVKKSVTNSLFFPQQSILP